MEPNNKVLARSKAVRQFLSGQHHAQPNHDLHRAQELTARQSTAPEHEVGVKAFLLEFECQNGIVYHPSPT
jgi:hypothetical protein